jgi:putative transposase
MARPLRTLFPGIPTHVVQRGNNRLRCFFEDNDRRFYLAQLAELSAAFGCGVHAYVLMDNHVHLLITPSKEDSISLLMKNLGQRFVQFINREHGRTGALWEGRYYSGSTRALTSSAAIATSR